MTVGVMLSVSLAACTSSPQRLKSVSTSTTSDIDQPYPGVIGDCSLPGQKPQYKPGHIAISCKTGEWTAVNLTWTEWGHTSANGSGLVGFTGCTPTCASAHTHYYTAAFTLTDVRQSIDGPAFAELSVKYQKTGPNGRVADRFSIPLPGH
jgi:hypothetical protein